MDLINEEICKERVENVSDLLILYVMRAAQLSRWLSKNHNINFEPTVLLQMMLSLEENLLTDEGSDRNQESIS